MVPAAMATPPSNGVGARCHLSSLGRLTKPRRVAHDRMNGEKAQHTTKAVETVRIAVDTGTDVQQASAYYSAGDIDYWAGDIDAASYQERAGERRAIKQRTGWC